MTDSPLARGIKMYWEYGYYTVLTVRNFFHKKNYDKGLLAESDFEEITGISFEFYEEHKKEISNLKYQAFQAWMENFKVAEQQNITA